MDNTRRENFEQMAIKAKDGDEKALVGLWNDCCIILNYYLDKNNYYTIRYEDRGDLKQDLYFLLVRLVKEYNPTITTFHGYFYKSMHFFVVEKHNKNLQNNIKQVEIEDITEYNSSNITNADNKIDQQIFIHNAKQLLKPNEFNTFYSYYFDGKTAKEIAKERGVCKQTVNNQRNKAIIKIYGRNKNKNNIDRRTYNYEYYHNNRLTILYSIKYRRDKLKAKANE